ncbi:unnamed protein product [Prorocentrum cordatum]|uniref:Uncharacterized protein n=1 Tax=Prorocentrum cordatum TaxID=2364126 RepID=A0ABN9R859_9DINO|nr:unnamed protein product [Polarella glacialis]
MTSIRSTGSCDPELLGQLAQEGKASGKPITITVLRKAATPFTNFDNKLREAYDQLDGDLPDLEDVQGRLAEAKVLATSGASSPSAADSILVACGLRPCSGAQFNYFPRLPTVGMVADTPQASRRDRPADQGPHPARRRLQVSAPSSISDCSLACNNLQNFQGTHVDAAARRGRAMAERSLARNTR